MKKKKVEREKTKEPHLISFGKGGWRDMENKHSQSFGIKNKEKIKPIVKFQNKTLLNQSGSN